MGSREPDLSEVCESLCVDFDDKIDKEDLFECDICNCTFAVIGSEDYTTISCPICSMTIRNSSNSDIKWICDNCGNIFTTEREAYMCPSCGGEDIHMD